MILTNSCLQITAIKDAWKTTDVMEEIDAISKTQSSQKFRPSLINGLSQPPNFEEILSSLPSKPAADKLVHHFFECYSPAIPARSKRSSVLLVRYAQVTDMCISCIPQTNIPQGGKLNNPYHMITQLSMLMHTSTINAGKISQKEMSYGLVCFIRYFLSPCKIIS